MEDATREILDRQKFVWSLGDYSKIAEMLRPASHDLVATAGVGKGTTVLDVGAGTGNLAMEAAFAGGRVIATDLTPHLIEIGKQRSKEAGLDIEWQEADAQNLPFEDGSFDVVGSAFGAMFAPNADAAVQEMLRVTKPGGLVAMTAWASDGYTGQTLAVSSRYMPPPPEGVNTVGEWGDEEVARSRFAPYSDQVEVKRGTVTWDFASRDEAETFWKEQAPPAVAAKMALPPERFEQMAAEIAEVQERFDHGTGGRVTIDSEYLLVTARRSG